MTELRRLNEVGTEQLLGFIHRVKDDASAGAPLELLIHSATSESLGDIEVEVEAQTFGSRFAAGEYLYKTLGNCGLKNLDRDIGLWAWLSLFYFEELCPKDRKGKRSPGEDARWVLNFSSFRYYRHLLLNPFQIYRAHRSNPECARILLCNPLDEPGEMVGQLAARQESVTNAALIGAASLLYVDPKTGKAKRGSGSYEKLDGRTRGKPGTVRRLVDVWKQLDVTWDMYSMNVNSLISLLPNEFDKYRKT